MTYTQPLLLLFGAVAVIGLFRLRACTHRLTAALGIGGFILVSWPPMAWLSSQPLERHYPVRQFQTNSSYQAIVIFSGDISPPSFERPYALPDEDTFHRIRFGAWVYETRPVPVLLCGGRGSPSDPPFSLWMRDLLAMEGVSPDAIWTEEESTSTHLNAEYGAAILKQHGITHVVLVVDATSMPRAQLCLSKQGIYVIPAPSEFYEIGGWQSALPSWAAIRQNELVLHESLALAWYRIRGWI